MNDIKIVKSENRHSCNVCKKHTDNLYELHFGSINVCLCKDCFITTRKKMYSIFNV